MISGKDLYVHTANVSKHAGCNPPDDASFTKPRLTGVKADSPRSLTGFHAPTPEMTSETPKTVLINGKYRPYSRLTIFTGDLENPRRFNHQPHKKSQTSSGESGLRRVQSEYRCAEQAHYPTSSSLTYSPAGRLKPPADKKPLNRSFYLPGRVPGNPPGLSPSSVLSSEKRAVRYINTILLYNSFVGELFEKLPQLKVTPFVSLVTAAEPSGIRQVPIHFSLKEPFLFSSLRFNPNLEVKGKYLSVKVLSRMATGHVLASKQKKIDNIISILSCGITEDNFDYNSQLMEMLLRLSGIATKNYRPGADIKAAFSPEDLIGRIRALPRNNEEITLTLKAYELRLEIEMKKDNNEYYPYISQL